MSRETPASGVDQKPIKASSKPEEAATMEPYRSIDFPKAEVALDTDLAGDADVLDQAVQLPAKAKVALIRKLITQLESDQIQTVLEFGLREIGDRHRRGVLTASISHNTRLLLKKDYSYQDRGLSQPTQYYVYLRRRKPKLDRYIGALFYIPEGCTFDYFLDAEGRIVFKPPHNVFRLQDCKNSNLKHTVRLICLQPPPPDYTFTKQQNDTPEIYLHLEYLDPTTHRSLTKQTYGFPMCMHEGGELDRYRWEVSTVTLQVEQTEALEEVQHNLGQHLDQVLPNTTSSSINLSTEVFVPPTDSPQLSEDVTGDCSPSAPPEPLRRVFKLPATKSLKFVLLNPDQADAVLKRMRMWVTWSEKAMPQSKWEVVQRGDEFILINAHFKRSILKFSVEQSCITLENSLPVLMKWFHDLSLAVSQAQNQRLYSAAQLKLAHNLFVDMSLPQTDSVVVLKKLFGVDFSDSNQ